MSSQNELFKVRIGGVSQDKLSDAAKEILKSGSSIEVESTPHEDDKHFNFEGPEFTVKLDKDSLIELLAIKDLSAVKCMA